MTTEDRTAYIKGLRALADVLEQNPGIRLPLGADSPDHVVIMFHDRLGVPAREALAAAARAFPCNWQKDATDSKFFNMQGRLAGLGIELTAVREAVCERVVTGTREVTRKVPDPVLLAKVPEIEVTEEVEDVEWRCHPVLATNPVSPGPEEVERATHLDNSTVPSKLVGTLVRRADDDAPCPQTGEVIGVLDGEYVTVAWGKDRHHEDGSATGTTEALDELVTA